MSDNTRGALLMMAAMAAFTVNDAFMKTLAGQMPLFQAIFLRGLATTAVFLVLAWRLGALRLPASGRDRRLMALRSLGEVGAAGCFLTALFNMPLANATAILQSLPLVITLAGAVFLREPVGPRRWSAIAIGFVGVLLIVRPGAEGFTGYSLLALASVGFVTLRDIVTRQMSAGLPSVTVALAASATVTVAFGLASIFGGGGVWPGGWVMPTGTMLAVLAGAAVFVIAGYMLAVSVMRRGEIGFIAPFRYTSLLWALLLGWLVFGDWPEPLTLLGAGIVVATGSFTLWRSGRLRAPPARTRPDRLG
ncbi:MAG: DMT family transporter [Alkalilacustris sp.]